MLCRDFVASAVLAGVAVVGASAQARATSYGAGDILANFNVVTVGNLNMGNYDAQGPLLAGGNLSAPEADGHNVALSAEFAGYAVVDAYGNVTYQNPNGIGIDAAGTIGGYQNGDSNAHAGYSFPTSLANFVAPLQTLSANLAAMSGTTVTSLTQNNAVLEPTSTVTIDGVTVGIINVTGAVLSEASSFTVDDNGAQLVVVNVDAVGSYSYTGNLENVDSATTLFNFYNATSLTLGGWSGSVLAPDASVTSNGSVISGSVFADSFTAGGEQDWAPLDSNAVTALNGVPSAPPLNGGVPPTGGGTVNTPEPASLALLGAGLLGLLVVRRHANPLRA